MGKQYNKGIKSSRRKAYIKRKKTVAKTAAAAKKKA